MTTPPPAVIGMPLSEVETPALLLDLDAFERNLKRLAQDVAGTGLRLRPHAKTHKSPTVALAQMALGAVGSCCQKVSEAEAMVNGGVPDVYVSNQVVGAVKWRRLAQLARRARVSTCVDDPMQIQGLSRAAQDAGVTLDVLVELNVGADRCGVNPGEPVAELALQISKAPGLRFAGIQAYQGAAQHQRTPAEREASIAEAVRRIGRSREALTARGLTCETVTGAGTGTYPLEMASGVYHELQAGSYAFMDVDYAKNRDAKGGQALSFEHSLFVYATVVSRPIPERAVLDAGLKSLSVDSGLPLVHGMPDVEYQRAADEHGKLLLKDPKRPLAVGDKLMLIPGHCDPTINLYDWYVCVRGGRVEALWAITARGQW
ncbi:MAG: DSD1 family PLP-dependent enzyme [Deltaproteobacteria bacterium]|nr:DSD1 family PLP-dependent enzyme [Deltaproteobacteria bacterium]